MVKVKKNWSALVVVSVLAFGSGLGLGTGSAAQAEDMRAPMVRQSAPRPANPQRGAPVVHVAQARGGAAQRRSTADQRSSAVQRRETAKAPSRERAQAARAGNGTARSR